MAEVGAVGRGPAIPPCGCCAVSQVNESWFLEDCTVARCEGDNRVTLLGPRPMSSITCVNGHLPVKVQNQSHRCDYHYECECERRPWFRVRGGLVGFETCTRPPCPGPGVAGPIPIRLDGLKGTWGFLRAGRVGVKLRSSEGVAS